MLREGSFIGDLKGWGGRLWEVGRRGVVGVRPQVVHFLVLEGLVYTRWHLWAQLKA